VDDVLVVLNEKKPLRAVLKRDTSTANMTNLIHSLIKLYHNPILNQLLRAPSLEFAEYALGYWPDAYTLVDFVKMFPREQQQHFILQVIRIIDNYKKSIAISVLALIANDTNIDFIRVNGGVRLILRYISAHYLCSTQVINAALILHRKGFLDSEPLRTAIYDGVKSGVRPNSIIPYSDFHEREDTLVKYGLSVFRIFKKACQLLANLEITSIEIYNKALGTRFVVQMEKLLRKEKEMEIEHIKSLRVLYERKKLGLSVNEPIQFVHDHSFRLVIVKKLLSALEVMLRYEPMRHYLQGNDKVQMMLNNEDNQPTEAITRFRRLRRELETMEFVDNFFDVEILFDLPFDLSDLT
jgi:hypothetical protein